METTAQSETIIKLAPFDKNLKPIFLAQDINLFNFASIKDETLFKIFKDDDNHFWIVALISDKVYLGEERLLVGQKKRFRSDDTVSLKKDGADDNLIRYTFIQQDEQENEKKQKREKNRRFGIKKIIINSSIVFIISLMMYVGLSETNKSTSQEGLQNEGAKESAYEDFWEYRWENTPPGKWIYSDPKGGRRYEYKNGDVYEGELKDNAPEGRGRMIWVNGDKYEGDWRSGKPNGSGRITWSNGGIYQGEVKDGVPEGSGKKKYVNQEIYHGDWENGKREGRGTLALPTGFRTFGEWKNDEIERRTGSSIDCEG